ncbi:MAG: hypothetical protein H7323_09665 [Frankiales bacterium]|nr:hypothetical protein [Frankiales bacterium]
MRRQLALSMLVTLTVLAPVPAFAQDSATPTSGMSPSPDCTGTRGGVSFDGPAPRAVVAGNEVTFTATFTGPLDNIVGNPGGYRWDTPTTKAPVQSTSSSGGGNRVLTEGETETRTVTLNPTTNTRFVYTYGYRSRCLFVDGMNPPSAQVIDVAPVHSIDAVRNGARDYTFSGASTRPGQVLNLYRVTASGSEVLTSQARTNTDGTWIIHREFIGSGRFGFLIRTGRDMANAPGLSRTRDTVIH